MQGESDGIGVGIVRIHFRESLRFAGAERAEEFLCLAFQLVQVRMFVQPASGWPAIHVSSFLLHPVSASSGRKEFNDGYRSNSRFQKDAVLSADTTAL